MTLLSPSQQAVLTSIKRQGIRYLPKNAVFEEKDDVPQWVMILGAYWNWTWDISQDSFTADYRRRKFELNKKGYRIVSFHVPWRVESGAFVANKKFIPRHGYMLLREPT